MRAFEIESLPGRVVFGAGSSTTRLGPAVARLGAARVLVVCTDRQEALASRLVGPFQDVVAGTFTAVRPHVPVDTVDAAMELVERLAVDGLVCVGGGSSIGTAKAVALRTGLPVVAVPTTYAGSEVTPVWGLTEAGRKTTGRSPLVLPRAVLYDPDLTVTLPAGRTATSAMNALAHCVEALYATGTNPVTDLAAVEGVRAIAAGLPRVLDDLRDAAGRADLLYGAYLAGSAFAVAGSGLHHRICHALGGAFDLPHAETHSVLLPHVVAFNESAVPALAARVAPALGSNDVTAGLLELRTRSGAPTALADIGMRTGDLDLAVRLVTDQDLGDNPRPIRPGDVRRILHDALHGKTPTSWEAA